MKKKLVLIGGGGHCRSCIDVIESEGKYCIERIVDLAENQGKSVVGSHQINAIDDDISQLVQSNHWFLITIGQIKTPNLRLKYFDYLSSLNAKLATIVSPLAHVSDYAELGAGTIVMHHALVNAGARIGQNCIINSKALIEHDSIIENHCHISTASVINGGTIVKQKTFFGSNAMAKEYIEIKQESIIKGGSAVTNCSKRS